MIFMLREYSQEKGNVLKKLYTIVCECSIKKSWHSTLTKFFYCLNWDVKYEHLDYDVVMKLLAHNGGMPGSFIISIFCQYSLGIFLHALFLKLKQNIINYEFLTTETNSNALLLL